MADNSESLNCGNTAASGYKPKAAPLVFGPKPNTALDLLNKDQSEQIFPKKSLFFFPTFNLSGIKVNYFSAPSLGSRVE